MDPDAPFLSETGNRSFLGIHAEPLPDLTPEAFCARAIEAYVTGALKGRLRVIKDGKDG